MNNKNNKEKTIAKSNKEKTSTKSKSQLNNLPLVNFELNEGDKTQGFMSLKNKKQSLKEKQGENLKSQNKESDEQIAKKTLVPTPKP